MSNMNTQVGYEVDVLAGYLSWHARRSIETGQHVWPLVTMVGTVADVLVEPAIVGTEAQSVCDAVEALAWPAGATLIGWTSESWIGSPGFDRTKIDVDPTVATGITATVVDLRSGLGKIVAHRLMLDDDGHPDWQQVRVSTEAPSLLLRAGLCSALTADGQMLVATDAERRTVLEDWLLRWASVSSSRGAWHGPGDLMRAAFDWHTQQS